MSLGLSISQFYILSPRGDTIITRDFRGDIPKGTAEIFFRKASLWESQSDVPPVFNISGINYLFIKKNGLFFVATTQNNSNPTFIIELLNKICKVFKDYCGTLSEESIRKNFVLLYELLDEMVDFGYPQTTQTEMLKNCIHNEAVMVVDATSGLGAVGKNLMNLANTNLGNIGNLGNLNLNPRTVPSNAVHRPVGGTAAGAAHDPSKKNEIFVDILERITVLMNGSGHILNSCIDGSIQMKSYLSGNPELKLALNEDLIIGQGTGQHYGSVILDDCNFHECVDLAEFDDMKILSFYPPDGEFSVMNYRITNNKISIPFKVFPHLEENGPYSLVLAIKCISDIPEQNYGGNVTINCQLPKNPNECVSSVSTEILTNTGLIVDKTASTAEYLASENKVSWNIKKFQGGQEMTIRVKINLQNSITIQQAKNQLGPISLSWEIPMYNVSKLQSYNPYRWVRYVTQSNSYVCRIGGA